MSKCAECKECTPERYLWVCTSCYPHIEYVFKGYYVAVQASEMCPDCLVSSHNGHCLKKFDNYKRTLGLLKMQNNYRQILAAKREACVDEFRRKIAEFDEMEKSMISAFKRAIVVPHASSEYQTIIENEALKFSQFYQRDEEKEIFDQCQIKQPNEEDKPNQTVPLEVVHQEEEQMQNQKEQDQVESHASGLLNTTEFDDLEVMTATAITPTTGLLAETYRFVSDLEEKLRQLCAREECGQEQENDLLNFAQLHASGESLGSDFSKVSASYCIDKDRNEETSNENKTDTYEEKDLLNTAFYWDKGLGSDIPSQHALSPPLYVDYLPDRQTGVSYRRRGKDVLQKMATALNQTVLSRPKK